MRIGKVVLVSVVLLTMTAASYAVIAQYTNRATWQGVVGTSDFTEDFSGFTVDTPYRAAAVNCNGFTMQQVGYDWAFRNFIDVAPFLYTDNNGTPHASAFVNKEEGTRQATTIELIFANPVRAWGCETWNTSILEGMQADVVLTNGTVAGTLGPMSPNNAAFLGFVATGGENVSKIVMRSITLSPGQGGEGFGLDNLAGAWVPEPATVLLLATVLLFRRR